MPTRTPLSRPLRLVRAAALVAAPLIAAGSGCRSEPPVAPKGCCAQPEHPAGVKPFTVVVDDAAGPSDGQKVTLRASVAQPVRRDELYPVLHTLYRHAMKRGAFEPIQLVAELYPSEGEARAGGDAHVLARMTRGQSDIVPRCDIRVRHDFTEQVARAFAASLGRGTEEDLNDSCHLAPEKPSARPDDQFRHKPSFKVITDRRAVAISYPYLEYGKDDYTAALTLNGALTYWIEFVTSMFRKVEDLQEVTYAGLWNDTPVLNITVNRRQYDSGLASLQEEIAAHGGVTFQSIGLGRMDDAEANKEQEAFKAKTYKLALSRLPKSQVTVSPKLK